jgi:hypothetical protein
MGKRKCESAKVAAVALGRLMPSTPQKRQPFAAINYRLQTQDEERRFQAAFDLFLAELVRQHLDPQSRT